MGELKERGAIPFVGQCLSFVFSVPCLLEDIFFSHKRGDPSPSTRINYVEQKKRGEGHGPETGCTPFFS